MRILGMLKADASSEAGAPPSKDLIERMGVFIEEVTKAGVMLDSNGLHPSRKGKRVRLANGKITVIDGPFTESKEIVVGYWVWEVGSFEEAVEWARRCPSDPNDTTTSWLEIRPCPSLEEFAEEAKLAEQA